MMNLKSRKIYGAMIILGCGIQLSYLMINIYAGYSLVYNPGLSKWLFIGGIVLSGMFFCGWLWPFGAVQEHR